MRQVNEIIIPSQAAATITSDAIPAYNLLYISAQAVSTGAGAAGTLKMQVSNDVITHNVLPQNWTDLSGASVSVSGAVSVIIPKQEICYQYVRFVYTNSGTGTIQVTFKAIGA